jgi:hypothetical protein|tara:strand:+ start:118 stop:276 length:159 start_codon:yes stop_codon:yes gene_type:complete
MSYDEASWARTIIGLGILFFCISIMAELAEHKVEMKERFNKLETLLMSKYSD